MTDHIIRQLQRELEPDAALLITGDASRFYVTGFASSAGTVLLTRQGGWFLIDFRYVEKARATVTGLTVRLSRNPHAEVGELLAQQGITRLYIETEAMTVRALAGWREALSTAQIPEDDRFDRLLGELRSIKSPRELIRIRQAQALTDDTFAYILDRIRPGRTEREIALDMEMYMRQQGSEGVSFDFIVVSGKNASLPHGVPTHKPVEKGDFVTMDFGAVIDGYRSDMTRTVAVGTVTDRQQQVYDTVLQAQLAALDAIRPGVVCKDVDTVARGLIDRAGFAGCFGHGLGHSVGIEIHESPSFNTRCDTVLRPGMVMTVEPGIYLENQYGVRIEDMVAITEDGYDNLTASRKDLILV